MFLEPDRFALLEEEVLEPLEPYFLRILQKKKGFRFGIDAVLVTPSCHDPLFRRASRTSQGTVLQVPWTRIGTQRQWAAEGIPLLHAAGFKVAALALEDRSLALGDPRLAECERLAMVLGTEGAGLFPSTIAACDYTVKIPMAHGVDSLNVAAASAVAFWELRAR